MNRLIFLLLICININLCFSQSFHSVNIYISNPYVERCSLIRDQMYNMDYVRSHYATKITSIEKNYIKALYDSLFTMPLTQVDKDSFYLILHSFHPGCNGSCLTDFEPCIVIDFVAGYDNYLGTFAMDRRGYIYMRGPHHYDLLYYLDMRCIDFLERLFPKMFSLYPRIKMLNSDN